MKLLAEILLAIFLHPLVWVLCIVNIVGRQDMRRVEQVPARARPDGRRPEP